MVVSLKSGHCEIQIRPQGVKVGQYPAVHGNRLATPEPFLNSADADRTSVEGQTRTSVRSRTTSALAPGADIDERYFVGFGSFPVLVRLRDLACRGSTPSAWQPINFEW